MDNTNIEKENELTNNPNQVVEKLSPLQEYNLSVDKRKHGLLLFLLLAVLECAICLAFVACINTFDLHYRVTKQIENSLFGKNHFSTGTYIGETDFGYFFGDGIFEYKSGSVYNGHWDNNQMQGLGALKVPNKGKYLGNFKESKKCGEGVFTWDDGTVYDGEWKNDKMEGQGTYISFDGVKYVGTFKENDFEMGKCYFKNDTGTFIIQYKEFEIDNINITFIDGTTYSGSCDGTNLTGTGTMKYKNGDKYVGDYKSGLRNGQGVYTWKNGDVYNGTWKEDYMSGKGKYTYKSGSSAEGTFCDNSFTDGTYKVDNDFGTYDFTIEDSEAISVEMNLKNGTTYSGDVSNDELSGTAQIKYSNGDKYSGKVKSGYKTGKGTYTWKSGASYDGEWKKDKMHGTGTYFYPKKKDGYKLSGSFRKGVPNGKCQYYESDDTSYKTDWSNGKCVKVYE